MSGIVLIVDRGREIFQSESGLGILTFDATLEESFEFAAEVTDHEVQDGAAADDHIQVKADTYTLRGFVTNTPVSGSGDPDANRLADTVALMEQILKTKTLIKIVTPLRVFDNLALIRVGVSRSGASLSITPVMEFKHIRKVKLATVAIPASITRADIAAAAQSKLDKGQQAKKTADQTSKLAWDENKTVAKNALENVAKLKNFGVSAL